MKAKTNKALKYLKDNYGLEPSDLDMTVSDITIARIKAAAIKYDLDKLEDWNYGKATKTMARYAAH